MSAIVSRRKLLAAAVSASGAMGAGMALLSAPHARASDSGSQLRKEDVRYQEQPKGAQRCAACKNFVNPSACRVVTGAVSANGWCLLFQAKAT